MTNRLSSKLLCIVAVVTALATYHSVSAEKHPPAASRIMDDEEATQSFMHAKLEATHQIIDGLAYEDFAGIEDGADELLRMTELSSWKVRRDPIYMHYSADFERTALRLQNAARARNIEKTTFAYMHLTVSCTICHQHVRNVVQIAPSADAKTAPADRTVIR